MITSMDRYYTTFDVNRNASNYEDSHQKYSIQVDLCVIADFVSVSVFYIQSRLVTCHQS